MRYIAPTLIGFFGCAVLLWLTFWQLQRLEWKEGILQEIESKIGADAVPLPQDPDPERHRYLPVSLTGDFTGEHLKVLVSVKLKGPGYRLISVMETDFGRRVMVDRGFIPEITGSQEWSLQGVTVNGNLHWPDEIDQWTPEPEGRYEDGDQIWFARDVALMAGTLRTDPVLVVSKEDPDSWVMPLPVDTAHIPNDHRQYAMTWFSLAIIWLGMTAYWLWRITQTPAVKRLR